MSEIKTSNFDSQASVTHTAVTSSSSSDSLTSVFQKQELSWGKSSAPCNNDIAVRKGMTHGYSVTPELAAVSVSSRSEEQKFQLTQSSTCQVGPMDLSLTKTINDQSTLVQQSAPLVVTDNKLPPTIFLQNKTSLQPHRQNDTISEHIEPVANVTVATPVSAVPEFLYQLSKMLTDNNRDIIEWNHGKIEVHNPQRLESEVLKKYFRHSKFASFQRQLNYFGFRKLAGKGKMAPCSYVNDAAGLDVNSLLHIKRKSNLIPQDKDSLGKKTKPNELDVKNHATRQPSVTQVNPVLAGIFNRNKDAIQQMGTQSSSSGHSTRLGSSHPTNNSPGTPVGFHAIAQTAVGRGIRHGFPNPLKPSGPVPLQLQASVVSNNSGTQASVSNRIAPNSRIQYADEFDCTSMPGITNSTTTDFHGSFSNRDCLSQLESNFLHSYTQAGTDALEFTGDADPTPLSQMRNTASSDTFTGFLSRNSSLVDLAMIVPVHEGHSDVQTDESSMFDFIDFPNPDVFSGSSPSNIP